MLRENKAQTWSFDLVIGITIFIIAIIVFYLYVINFSNEREETLTSLSYDLQIVSSNLLSEGSPKNWTPDQVYIPGIVSNKRIDETKIKDFYTLVQTDYAGVKRLLNTKFDFYFFFSEKIETDTGFVDGIGKYGVNRTNIIDIENPKNILKITRITIYRNKPMPLSLYLWKK